MKRTRRVLAAVAMIILAAGCGEKKESATAAPVSPSGEVVAADGSPTSASIAAARNDLKAGRVDDAAAKLAGLQMQQTTFTTEQAKDYRQALSDAFDKAMDAAQKGDPKAEAAIQLLRAAGPR